MLPKLKNMIATIATFTLGVLIGTAIYKNHLLVIAASTELEARHSEVVEQYYQPGSETVLSIVLVEPYFSGHENAQPNIMLNNAAVTSEFNLNSLKNHLSH